MKYKSYKKFIAVLTVATAMCTTMPLISRAAIEDQAAEEQPAEPQPESQPQEEPSDNTPQDQPAESAALSDSSTSQQDSGQQPEQQPEANEEKEAEPAAENENDDTSSNENSAGGDTGTKEDDAETESGTQKDGTETGTEEKPETASDDSTEPVKDVESTDAGETGSTKEPETGSTKDSETEQAKDQTDPEKANEADTIKDDTKEEDAEKITVRFSGTDGISIKDGETVDLLSGVLVSFEKEDGTKEEKQAYVKSVTDQDGNAVSLSGSSLTAVSGKTYTVTYGVDGKEDTAERTVTVADEAFKANVQFSGLDDLTVDAESDTDVAKGVTAIYQDKDGSEQTAEVSIKSISVDGLEIGTEEQTDAAYQDGNTLCNAQSEKTYTVVFKNNITDQTAERKVHVNKKEIHVTFTGTDDTKILADIDYVLTSGVSASYTDRSGEHTASVVIKKVTDGDGNDLPAGTVLKSPESEQTYSVTYGNDLTDETVTRKITVEKAEYKVTFSGTDDLDKTDGESADLLNGVSVQYDDLAGKSHDVKVSVKSVRADGRDVFDKESETDAYLDGDTLKNLQADMTYTVVYGNDKTDDTVKRTITVSNEYLDDISVKCGGVKVTVSARKTLTKKMRLFVERDSVSNKVRTDVKKDLIKDKKTLTCLLAYSIVVKDKKGNPVALPDDAKVTLEYPDDTEVVLYTEDVRRDKKGTGKVTAGYEKEILAAEVEDAEYVQELSAKCGDTEIVLTSKGDIFTKGSTVKVRAEKDTGSYEDSVKKSDEKDAEKIESVDVYDITILDADGDEYEPEGEMSITFKDAGKDDETVEVYQFKDGDTDKMKKLDTDKDSADVTCKTDSL